MENEKQNKLDILLTSRSKYNGVSRIMIIHTDYVCFDYAEEKVKEDIIIIYLFQNIHCISSRRGPTSDQTIQHKKINLNILINF